MKTKHTPLLLFLTLACVAPAAVSAQILKLPTTWGGDRSSRVRFSWSNKDRYSLQQDPSNLAACRGAGVLNELPQGLWAARPGPPPQNIDVDLDVDVDLVLDGVGDVDFDRAFDLGVDPVNADAQVNGVVKVHVTDAVNVPVNAYVNAYV